MNYTDEQRAILAQYEEYLRTATRSDWSRNPGPRALEQINDILYAGKPNKPRVNYGCQQCILRLLKDAGTLYFADLAEIEATEKAAKTAKPADLEAIEELAAQAAHKAASQPVPATSTEQTKQTPKSAPKAKKSTRNAKK